MDRSKQGVILTPNDSMSITHAHILLFAAFNRRLDKSGSRFKIDG